MDFSLGGRVGGARRPKEVAMSLEERDPDNDTSTPGPRADADQRTEADAGLTGGEGAASGPPVGEDDDADDTSAQ